METPIEKPADVLAFLEAARAIGNLSKAEDRKVGCVVVKNRAIVSSGCNGTLPGQPNTFTDEQGVTLPSVFHAEVNALDKMAVEGISAKGTVIVLTDAPCLGCAMRIVGAGALAVIYDKPFKNSAGIDYLKNAGILVLTVNSIVKT